MQASRLAGVGSAVRPQQCHYQDGRSRDIGENNQHGPVEQMLERRKERREFIVAEQEVRRFLIPRRTVADSQAEANAFSLVNTVESVNLVTHIRT